MDLKLEILKILKGEEGLTFLELKKRLKDRKIIFSLKKLKSELLNLEKEDFIEERHFRDGLVDYSLERRGYNYLNKKVK